MYSKKEQAIYDCAGGGKAGEKAVMERRRYLNENKKMCSGMYKGIYQNKFTYRNEKATATLSTLEDNYN